MNHISSTSEDNEMSNQEEYEPSPPLKESVDHLRAIELLGQQTVENLYSKKWQERKKGLASVQQRLESVPSAEASKRASGTSQSSTGSKSPSTKSVRISDDLPKRNEDAPTSCQHCGANFESPPSNLDMENHHRNKCPLFTKCDDCSQVLMVSSVASHRRNECRARDNYRTCPRCGESIERSLFHRHVGRKDCRRKCLFPPMSCLDTLLPFLA
ncbi:hypothetical protein GCK32_010739 [Trichostrongylus colubriformis]|uniref:Centrosomal protein CEP104 Zn finger domain-containing protein n=1 Tax=Trichostrongylus colubriformis TaxID=6319 RepID=A0AAN8FNK1_TRICO